MSLLLYRIGHFCARHRWPVLTTWLVIVVGVAVAAREVGAVTSDNLTLPGTGSTEATDLLDERLPKDANGSVPIVLEASSGKLTDGSNSRAVDRTVDLLKRNEYVLRATSPLSREGEDALSKDERIGYISVTLTLGPDELDESEADSVIAAADPARDAGLTVAAGGYLGQEVSKPSTETSERIGIAAAIVILLFAFGTAVAMTLPISTAILGLITGLAVIAILGHGVEVPTVAPTLATMIGLGVGIDYSLFIVTRYRRRLADGLEVNEAIARSTATSGSAVAFAGGTVVIALCSLAFADIPLVSALGYTAAIVVLIAMVAANTLLPALLAALGHRIEALKVPGLGHHPTDDRPHGWARWAEAVAKRRIPAALVSVLLLVALAIPVFGIRLGQEDDGQLPESTQSRQSYDLIAEGFGVGTNGPFLIAVRFDPPAHNDQRSLNQLKRQQRQQEQQEQQQIEQQTEALEAQGVPPDEAQQEATEQVEAQAPTESAAQQRKLAEQKKFLRSDASDPDLVHLENKIANTDGVKSVSQAKVDRTGTAAVFTAIPKTAPSAEATSDLVNTLRDEVIPEATAGTGLTAHVGGTTAGYIDLADRIGEKLPLVIAIVVALAFLLLMVAFRSIVVPITAALMNLLSVAASYGVLTAVFEDGFAIGLIGLDHEVPIVSFVPLMMFAILFGLSMDYQVFLVSRIGEHWVETKDNTRSVIEGVATSARVITSAALIMVSVFASFVLNGDPAVKQFGLGMAVAIAVDATIVRCLLVPAVMVMLGKANWWLPRWLDRVIPRLGLEAEDALPPLPGKPVRPAPAQQRG
jgi:RND superfamily putative drug exporter